MKAGDYNNRHNGFKSNPVKRLSLRKASEKGLHHESQLKLLRDPVGLHLYFE